MVTDVLEVLLCGSMLAYMEETLSLIPSTGKKRRKNSLIENILLM
jgi:hypothetical protein